MGNCAGLSRDETMESLHGTIMNQQIASLEGMRLMQKNPKSSQFSKNGIYEQMLNRKLNSGIFLEAQILIKLPIKDPFQQCRLDFKIKYSVFETSWFEHKTQEGLEYLSKKIQFEYMFQADKQEIIVELITQPQKSKQNRLKATFTPQIQTNLKQDVKSPQEIKQIQLMDSIVTEGEEFGNSIKTVVTFSLHQALQSKFLQSQKRKENEEELKIEIQNSFENIKEKKNLFTCKPLKVDFHSVCENEAVLELNVQELKSIKRYQMEQFLIQKDQDGQEQEKSKINPFKIRFQSYMDFTNKADEKLYQDKNLHFLIREELEDETKSETAKNLNKIKIIKDCQDCAIYDQKTKIFDFPLTKISSDQFSIQQNQNILDKKIVIEIQETYFETQKKKKNEQLQPIQKEKFVCKAIITILGAIKFARNSVYMIYLTNQKGKPIGRLYLKNFQVKSHYTFMDLYINNSLNIIPIIAIDFSLANLTFDESQYCIHTLKEGAPNDYIDCLSSVFKAFYYFSRFMMGFGFGARTFQNDDGPACNLFSITGDFKSPFIESKNQMIDCYEKTLKSVKLALPVLYQQILKFVCDLAQHDLNQNGEGNNSDIKSLNNYYVLVLMMAGMVDDFKDAINELFRASNLPISVIVIKIGKDSQENDSLQFIKQSSKAFEDSERVFLDIFDFENYKNEKGEHSQFFKQQLEYDIIKSIPNQIEKFFEVQKYEKDSDEFTDQKIQAALQKSITQIPVDQDIKSPSKQQDKVTVDFFPNQELIRRKSISIVLNQSILLQEKTEEKEEEEEQRSGYSTEKSDESDKEQIKTQENQPLPEQQEISQSDQNSTQASIQKQSTLNFDEITQVRQKMILKHNIKQEVLQKIGEKFQKEMKARKNAKNFQDNGVDYKEKILQFIDKQTQSLVNLAVDHGIKEQHALDYLREKQIPDYDVQNFIARLQDDKIITQENGYLNPQFIVDQFKKKDRRRRTEAELDQMKGFK